MDASLRRVASNETPFSYEILVGADGAFETTRIVGVESPEGLSLAGNAARLSSSTITVVNTNNGRRDVVIQEGPNRTGALAKYEKQTDFSPGISEADKCYALDSCGKYAVQARYDSSRGALLVVLENREPALRSDDSRVSRLVSDNLRLRINGEEYPLESSRDSLGSLLVLLPPSTNPIVLEAELRGKPMFTAHIDGENGATIDRKYHRLMYPFDMRNFATRGEAYFESFLAAETAIKYRPIVDLHTHYSGQVAASTLVELGVDNNVSYPASLLRLAGITRDFGADDAAPFEPQVALSDLTKHELALLTAAMQIEPTQVITFEEMEVIYKLRSPITKNPEFFPVILEDIALRYQAQGVKYAELSCSEIVKPEWLEKAHACLPDIERRTGVELRFLAGIWRHSPEHFMLDIADQVMHAATISPWVVGVDFMGHETNSTLAFRDVISSKHPWSAGEKLTDPRTGRPRGDGLAEFAERTPGFQIRVHAGENPVHPGNVRDAVEAGATRVGHGLYGVSTAKDLELLRKKGVRVEFNGNSNRALNNIDGLDAQDELPIKEYHDAGISTTFGQDGSIYRGGGRSETYIARQAGMSEKDLLEVAKSDADYKKSMRTHFVKGWSAMVERCIDNVLQGRIARDQELSEGELLKMRSELTEIAAVAKEGPRYHKLMNGAELKAWEKFEVEVLQAGKYGLPPQELFPRSTFDWSTWSQAKNERIAKLTFALSEKGITTHDEQELDRLLAGRTPILLSGASASSWKLIQDPTAVTAFLEQLVANSDPREVVFVTGATDFGVEKVLHDIVKKENADRLERGDPTFSILGTVVEETKPEEIGPITDAVLLGERWYSKSGKVVELVKERRGRIIFIGGGNILNDEIQAAWNVRADFYLMKGPEGASTTKAESFPERAFMTYEDYARDARRRQ